MISVTARSALRTIVLAMVLTLAVAVALAERGIAATTDSVDSARDPQDVAGRLDIVFVRAAARDDHVILTVRTAEEWGCRFLRSQTSVDSRRSASLRWHIDTNNDPYTEHVAFAGWRNGDCVVTFTDAGRTFLATRPDRRTLRVVLPRDRFGLDREDLEIIAISRVDAIDGDAVLFDEEDVAPALHPYGS